MQSRRRSLSFFLLFFSLGGELDMGHASLCWQMCYVYPKFCDNSPALSPQHHARLDGEVSRCLWESCLSLSAPKILWTTFLWNPSHLVLKGNSRMVMGHGSVMSSWSLGWNWFWKSPTKGSITLLSTLITYLSALLGHRKVTPFEPSNCIF